MRPCKRYKRWRSGILTVFCIQVCLLSYLRGRQLCWTERGHRCGAQNSEKTTPYTIIVRRLMKLFVFHVRMMELSDSGTRRFETIVIKIRCLALCSFPSISCPLSVSVPESYWSRLFLSLVFSFFFCCVYWSDYGGLSFDIYALLSLNQFSLVRSQEWNHDSSIVQSIA